ncbi:hypothetical protein BDW68DRAFT_179877 [Aspergillus falconensis]
MITECLRDRARFPPLSSLPISGSSSKHYCFVSEILSATSIANSPYHTELAVRDYGGTKTTVACSFPRGSTSTVGWAALRALRPGVTVFILNARTQILQNGRVGIVLADAAYLKVNLYVLLPAGSSSSNLHNVYSIPYKQTIPTTHPPSHYTDRLSHQVLGMPLSEFITLNNSIREFTSEIGGRRCFGCAKRRIQVVVFDCPLCGFVAFCNNNKVHGPLSQFQPDITPDCLHKGLRDYKHERYCDILQDADMRRLLSGQWDGLMKFESVDIRAAVPTKSGLNWWKGEVRI